MFAQDLFDISSFQPEFMFAVILLGVGVGILTGLFGVGGAFIATPILISLFAIEPTTAIGCMLGYTVGAGLMGIKSHRKMGNVEWRAMLLIGAGACTGTLLGCLFHHRLAAAAGPEFEKIITGFFLLLLIPIAWSVGRRKENDTKPSTFMNRLAFPPYIKLSGGAEVSFIGLVLCGFSIGLLKGTFGIGGGVILIPILVFIVGLKPHVAVGTSLGVVLLSSLVGCVLYAQHIDWTVVGLMVGGGIVGVHIGSRICNAMAADQLRRSFAMVMLIAAGLLVFDLSYDLMQAPDSLTLDRDSATSIMADVIGQE